MNTEEFRDLCLSLPFVTEDTPFDETTVVYRLRDKIFACIPTECPNKIVLKCDPALALELRARYDAVQPAWHWNKKYWNDITLNGSLSDKLLFDLTCHAYDEVNKKLSRYIRVDFPFDISEIAL